MSNKISDNAMAKVPSLTNRISLFQSKLQISKYAAGSITDYCHAIYKAVDFIEKLPEDKSYILICKEKGWKIGICPSCDIHMKIIEVIRPRSPPANNIFGYAQTLR